MLRSTRRLKRLRRIKARRAAQVRSVSKTSPARREAVAKLVAVVKLIRVEAEKAKLELNIKPAPATPAPAPVPAPSPPASSSCEVSGTVRYVSPSGSDSNPGTIAQPWKTLEKADNSATPGMTIALRGGTHGAKGEISDLYRNGTTAAPIRWVAHNNESASVAGQLSVWGDNVKMCGLALVGETGRVSTPTSANPTGGMVKVQVTGDNFELRNSEISKPGPHSGLYMHEAVNFRVINNHIHDNGGFSDPSRSNLDHGMYIYRGSGLIEGNRFVHNLAHAVQLYPYASGVTVRNNTMTGHGKSALIFAGEASNNIAENNKIWGNAAGIQTWDLSGRGNIARNNELWDNSGRNFIDSAPIAMSSNIAR